MLAIKKQAAKAILPTPFLNRYVNTMGQLLRLQKVPMKRFDAGNLRSLALPELSRIFHDPELLPRGRKTMPPLLVSSAARIILSSCYRAVGTG
jgi:hypothetical protein